jgi:MerR family transcriptional regulator, thiopeptide resistance regulator
MEERLKDYTVHQLAHMARVSVRTLHHYDQIGLLQPGSRSAAGYRQYGEKDLLRLQQILFFKELDIPLAEIGRILDDPSFDQVQALRQHRHMLEAQADRLAVLLKTVDRTIDRITEANMTLTDEELYEGFTQEQIQRYSAEVNQKYDPKMVEESNRRVRKMSKEKWQAVRGEGEAVTRLMASYMGRPVGDAKVQAAVKRHHAWIENFYPCSAEIYRGLGQLYTENDEFRATYEKYAPGLADYMKEAMEYFCQHTLKG